MSVKMTDNVGDYDCDDYDYVDSDGNYGSDCKDSNDGDNEADGDNEDDDDYNGDVDYRLDMISYFHDEWQVDEMYLAKAEIKRAETEESFILLLHIAFPDTILCKGPRWNNQPPRCYK